MHPKPDFWAYYCHLQVTSKRQTGSLLVTFGYVTFPDMRLTPASYSPVGAEMHSKREFSAFYCHLKVTYSQMTSLPDDFRLLLLT